jgi:hypothetical protein
MPLNRRQFFRSFWSPQKTLAQRQEQYRIMKSYVGAILIPFDFSLTPEQTSEVFAIADAALQSASDEDLFSDAIRIRLDQRIEPRIKEWYTELIDHVEEIRQIAPDYVTGNDSQLRTGTSSTPNSASKSKAGSTALPTRTCASTTCSPLRTSSLRNFAPGARIAGSRVAHGLVGSVSEL